jgi:hypothetical protein
VNVVVKVGKVAAADKIVKLRSDCTFSSRPRGATRSDRLSTDRLAARPLPVERYPLAAG